jgi:DNA/RNA endonuclease YhcR with UshA esterase domain
LGFWLAEEPGAPDGTEPGGSVAEVHVAIYRDVLVELLALGKAPALGDEVSVAGTLRIRESHVALTVNTAEHLDLRRPEVQPRQIGEVTILDEGRRVQLTGDVQRIYRPYEGLTLITLGDAGVEIVIAVSDVVTMLTGALPELVEGQRIRVDGVVTLYRAAPQIAPASVADIELLPPLVSGASDVVPLEPAPTLPVSAEAVPEAPPGAPVGTPSPTPSEARTPEPTATSAIPGVTLGQLDADDVGRRVRVRGQVVLLEGINGGVKATLDDGTGQVILLVWDDVHSALATPQALDAGAQVDAVGKVAIYEGVLEVVPATAAELTIVEPAPPAEWVEIRTLGPADVGRVVRIRGVIGAPEPFSAGVKMPLDDGTGVISLLLWSNLYDDLPVPPRAGQQVEVVGSVSIFREVLELIPRTIHDWRVGPPDG